MTMDIEIWLNNFYPKILSDFGFSEKDDERAAKLMHELGWKKLLDSFILLEKIKGKDVIVIGGAVNESDVKILKDPSCVKITAGKSILKIREIMPNFTPDVHVTDMEEPDELLIELERQGCILVLHAHGDNIDRIRSVVPKLSRFLATTQSKPFDRIYNFGGFTDGDRAAIIARAFEARKIRLVGFDFDKAEGIKLKKLRWAKKILEFEELL